MNLDDRIAVDADRWRKDDHAPPFDDALEVAVVSRGSARTTWLAVACVIALVAGVVAVFAVRGRTGGDAPAVAPPSPAISVSLPSPHTITRDGHTYYSQVIATPGVVTEHDDSSHLYAYHFDTYDKDAKPGCNDFSSSARIVAQDERTITVATFVYANRSPKNVVCGFTSLVEDPKPFVLALGRARDNRQVVDAFTGAPIAVFAKGTTPPKPTYLPAGLRQTDVEAAGKSSFSGAESARTFTDAQGDSIDVRLGSAGQQDPVATIGSSVVDGRRATITRDGYEQCVSWTVPGHRQLQVCSSTAGSSVRPVAELLKIARSLK